MATDKKFSELNPKVAYPIMACISRYSNSEEIVMTAELSHGKMEIVFDPAHFALAVTSKVVPCVINTRLPLDKLRMREDNGMTCAEALKLLSESVDDLEDATVHNCECSIIRSCETCSDKKQREEEISKLRKALCVLEETYGEDVPENK